MSGAISQYLKRVIEEEAKKLVKQKGVGPLIDDSKIFRSLQSYLNSVDNMEVTDPYEKSVWVFASINAIAQNISRVPFYIYEEKKDNLKAVVNEGQLTSLFMNPNPYMITSSLLFATVIFMELYGECFWVLEGRKNVTEIPTEIWCVTPTRFEPVFDKNRQFKGYWNYTARDIKITFAPHEILHFKYFNPYDDIRGLSGIQASRLGVEQDYFASKYNKQFFKDGVSLSGLVQAPDFLTDEQYNRLRMQFEERHSGYGNAHKVGVIEGGATFAETKTMSQRDMEFSVLKTVIRGEILAAFKTNEVVLGNYENIQSYEGIANAHQSFWKETLLPKIMLIEEFLWAKFFSNINGGKEWGSFDLSVIEALREDFKAKVEMADILNKIGYPINLINKRLDMGFEDVPWGNTWFVRMGTVPVEYVLENPIPEVTPPDEDDDPGNKPNEPEGDDEKPVEDPMEGEKDISLDKRDDSLWANFIAREVPVEQMFKSKLKRFLYEQRKRVLTNLYKSPEELLNVEEEVKGLEKVFTNLYYVASQTGKELLKEELIIDEIEYKEVDDFIDERLKFSARTIIKTIYNSLLKLLEENQSNTVKGQADKVRTLYNKTDNRVSTIARTESAAIMNGVRFLLMQKNGVKYHKWISRSENGRHAKFDGKIVRIGESFSPDFTLRFPTDRKGPIGESINCLCMTVPVINVKNIKGI
jgi:HK97 family phage portal protein